MCNCKMVSMQTSFGIFLPFCVQFPLLFYDLHLVLTDFISPKMPSKRFVKTGVVNLGALLRMSNFNRERQMCDDTLYDTTDVHLAQVMEYAVDAVNLQHMLPRNVTLGFVGLDDCYFSRVSVTQALTFMQQTSCKPSATANIKNYVESYDVVGVIGCASSSQTIPVARLLSQAEIPLISLQSTSDDLSNKTLFPYFLRTATPDKYQFRAMFFFIKNNGWTYASLVYEEGRHGESGFRTLQNLFDEHGMCLATVQKVSPHSNDNEIALVAQELVKHEMARVVILIALRTIAVKVISATSVLRNNTFIWIGNDGWSEEIESMKNLKGLLWGAFGVTQVSFPHPKYDTYFRKLKLRDTQNPWFPDFWEKYFNCSIQHTCNSSQTLEKTMPYLYASRIIDVINMYALAIARTLNSSNCPSQLVGIKARECIKGPLLLKELFNTRFEGHNGWIEIDKNGDQLGSYQVRQVLPASINQSKAGLAYDQVPVANYAALTDTLTTEHNLIWDHHWLPPKSLSPRSDCSVPCNQGEALVRTDVSCCWSCLACRNNERLVQNGTRCEACPIYTWPNLSDSALATCEDIPVAMPQLNSVTGIVFTIMALCSLLSCMTVFSFFISNRNERTIKASALILSVLMIFAISLGFTTTVTLQLQPNNLLCKVNYWFFCLSFALLYGPLLVRSFCIYRIFDSARKSTRRPFMVDVKGQMLLTFGICFIQIVICAIQMVSYPKWVSLTMKDATVPYVELNCEMHVAGMVSFLVYNLLMLTICAYLAFKSRHLPDNFNESHYISMCVLTTLLVWILFIPSYLIAPNEHVKTMVIALVLTLNHSMALVFLFLPRVFAVLYLKSHLLSSKSTKTQSESQRKKSSVFHTAKDRQSRGYLGHSIDFGLLVTSSYTKSERKMTEEDFRYSWLEHFFRKSIFTNLMDFNITPATSSETDSTKSEVDEGPAPLRGSMVDSELMNLETSVDQDQIENWKKESRDSSGDRVSPSWAATVRSVLFNPIEESYSAEALQLKPEESRSLQRSPANEESQYLQTSQANEESQYLQRSQVDLMTSHSIYEQFRGKPIERHSL